MIPSFRRRHGLGVLAAFIVGCESTSDNVLRLSRDDVARATHVDETTLRLELRPDAAERLRLSSEQHVGRKLHIIVDDEIVSSPLVREAIETGSVKITMKSPTELRALYAHLDP
jgi:preprotein translocase subunit SecD